MDSLAKLKIGHVLKAEVESWTKSDRKPYAEWANCLRKAGALPLEHLLPRITVRFEDRLTGPMERAEARFEKFPDVARDLAKMQWGYYFNLGGGLSTADVTPAFRSRMRAQTLLRMQMINDVIDSLVDDKSNTTLLDFASNWGGFALDMALRGLSKVSAFDFKPENVEKARRLAEYMGAENVKFEVQNVYALPPEYFNEGFDIVYNLGLLYHVTDPLKLITTTYRLTKNIAVFDSAVHREPFSGFILAELSETEFARPGMGEYRIELHPTYRAMIDMIKFAGFRDLVEIICDIPEGVPDREKDPYFQGLRRTIIAFK